MADDIYIKIKTLLEKASPEEVAKLQRDIQNKIQPVKLKIETDAKGLDKFTQTTKQALGEVENISERTKEWTQSLGVTAKETEKIDKNTGQINETVRKLTINYKEMNKLFDKQRAEIDAAIQKTIADRKKEQLVLEEKQSQIINKNIEAEIKRTMQLKEQLALYKQRMLGDSTVRGELDIFADKYKGKYDKDALSKIRSDVEALNISTPDLNTKIKQTRNQFTLLKKEAGEAGSVISRTFENLFKFMRFYLVGGTFVKLLSSFRRGVENLHQIDDALISIAKVTDYTRKEMEQLASTGIDVSKEYGRSVQDYLSAVTEFSRAGFGKDAQKYAELSLLLQNVGDVTAEVANETLIAANAGFQLGGSYEALMGIIDKFNHVSNLNATNINKLSEAMKVGAATFHSAGLSIDETVALIGTATASTQRAGAEVSRAFRTILMNIRQIKDEEAEVTEESMANAEKALNAIGIVVRDTPNTYRPMFDILRDLGNAFENLTPVQQAFTAESLANKRQADILISTLQNWNTVEKQLNESIGSSGSALRENEIYLQSWSAATSRLSSSLTSLYNNLLDTDSIISFINLLDKIVISLDTLINNQFSSAIIQIGLLTSGILLLNKGLILLKSSTLYSVASQYLAIAATKGWVVANTALIATTKTLTATLLASPLFWTVAVVAGIYGIVKAIDALNVTMEEYNEQVNESYNKTQNNIESIKSLKKEYEELSKQTELSKDQKLRLIEIERELKTKYGETTKELDLQNKSLEENSRIIDEAMRKEAERFKILNERAYKKAKELLNQPFTIDLGEGAFERFESIEKAIKHYEEVLRDATDKSNYVYNARKKVLEDLYEEYDNAIDIVDKYEGYEQLLGNTIKEVTNSIDDLTDAEKEALFIQESLTKQLQESLSDSDKKISAYQSALKELKETGKLSLSTISSLIEHNADLLVLLGNEVELRKALQFEIEKEEATVKKSIAEKLMANEEYYNILKKSNATYINKLSENYGIDLSNFKDLASAKLGVEQHLLTQLSKLWANYSNLTADHAKKLLAALEHDAKVFGIDPTQAQGYNLLKQLSEVDKIFEDFSTQGISVDFTSSASGIKSGTKKEIKEIAQYLSDDLAQAVDEVNLAIKESEYRMSQYDKTSQEYKDEINEQIKLYGDLIKIYEKGKQKAKERNQQILDNTTYMNFLNISTEEYNKLSEEQKERYNRLKQEYDKNISALNQYENAILGAKSSIDGLNNSLEEQAEQMRKTALETVSNLLNIEKNLRLDSLRKKQEAIIKGFQDMLDPDVIFNFQDFQHAIKDIISELDLIDEKFLSNVSFVTDTSKARSDLNAYKNDIISLANQAERFANMTSTSQSGLESIIRRQINFANNLQSELQQINNIIAEKTRLYKEQEEALQQQIQSVSDEYDNQISLQEEKLKLLDEEISAEERKRRLLEINDELEKALRDKRFEYITQEGERILTYDKAKVEEIEKRQTELVEQYQREDLKKAIQDEIDLIRNAKETELKILNDKLEETKKIHATEIQALQLYKSSIEEINRAVVSDANQKMNDLKNLQNEELDNFSKYWDNLIKAVEEGTATYDDILEVWYDESGNALKKYVDNVGSEFERLAKIWDSMQKLASTPLPTPSKTTPSSGSFSGSKGTTSGGIDYVVGTDGSSVITPPGSNPIVTTPNGTQWSVDPKTGIPTKLHTGGIVGENIQDNKAKLINNLFQTKDNEQLITALKKEVIVNPTLGMPNFISNMRNLVSSVIPKSSAINNIKNYHFKDLTIKADNVSQFLDSIDLVVATQG